MTPSGNIGETGALFESVSTSCHALSICHIALFCVVMSFTSFSVTNIWLDILVVWHWANNTGVAGLSPGRHAVE